MLFHGIVRLIVGLNLNDSPIVRYLGAASYLAEAFLLCSEMVAGGASKSAIPVILLVCTWSYPTFHTHHSAHT